MNLQKIATKIFKKSDSMEQAIANACLEYNLSNKQANELKKIIQKMEDDRFIEEDFLYEEYDDLGML